MEMQGVPTTCRPFQNSGSDTSNATYPAIHFCDAGTNSRCRAGIGLRTYPNRYHTAVETGSYRAYWDRLLQRRQDDGDKKGPERLLFVDIPNALGGAPAELGERIREPLGELLGAYPYMLAEVDAHLVQALDASPTDHAELTERAASVAHKTGDLRLDGFAARLQQRDGSLPSIEGILSLAASKPPRDWTDLDIDAAKVAITELAMAFRRAETLIKVEGRAPDREAFAVVIV